MIIEMGKQYRKKTGESVEILKIVPGVPYPVKTYCKSMDHMETYTMEGRLNLDGSCGELDIEEIPFYDELEIDDPVFVSGDGVIWCRRYFAGVNSDGEPMAFIDGKTQWSSYGFVPSVWKYCIGTSNNTLDDDGTLRGVL